MLASLHVGFSSNCNNHRNGLVGDADAAGKLLAAWTNGGQSGVNSTMGGVTYIHT